MRTFIRSAQRPVRVFADPLERAALPLFFALAFLPVILRLLSFAPLATHPLTALAPAAAGLWLAATRRQSHVSFALLAAATTTLFWAANWLMISGDNCCSLK